MSGSAERKTRTLAFAGRLVLRLLWTTYRRPDRHRLAAALEAVPRPTILLAWHDESFIISGYLRTLMRDHRLGALASLSGDGALVTRIAEPFGIHIVRGSASRGGSAGLRALYRAVSRNGVSPLILPDGPRGPKFGFKPGAVVLAQMTGAKLLPLHFHTGRWSRSLGSWDRMTLPLPGARLHVEIGEPVTVPRELSDEARDRLCTELGERLVALRRIDRS